MVSFRQLKKIKNASIFSILVGGALFLIGIYSYMVGDLNSFQEKFGTVYMTFGSMLLSLGFSFLVIWKLK